MRRRDFFKGVVALAALPLLPQVPVEAAPALPWKILSLTSRVSEDGHRRHIVEAFAEHLSPEMFLEGLGKPLSIPCWSNGDSEALCSRIDWTRCFAEDGRTLGFAMTLEYRTDSYFHTIDYLRGQGHVS